MEGYCFYTATNPTWGYDAMRLLQSLGGNRAYVKFPKFGGDSYYRPCFIYLFKSENMYKTFAQKLCERQLDGLIQIDKYRVIENGMVVIEEG